jgi:hypothetical protein
MFSNLVDHVLAAEQANQSLVGNVGQCRSSIIATCVLDVVAKPVRVHDDGWHFCKKRTQEDTASIWILDRIFGASKMNI